MAAARLPWNLRLSRSTEPVEIRRARITPSMSVEYDPLSIRPTLAVVFAVPISRVPRTSASRLLGTEVADLHRDRDEDNHGKVVRIPVRLAPSRLLSRK